MKREKSRRRKKNYIISSCIVMLIFFAGVLIMKSADWVQNEWNNVNFATIVFQMHTPLKGTNEEVVLNYIRACLIPA